jgi:hypothetical protein
MPRTDDTSLRPARAACARPDSADRSQPGQAGPGDPAACAVCGARGETCCRVEPGGEEFCFPLSPMEWERIRECMGAVLGEKGWFAEEINTDGFLANLRRLFPGCGAALERLFPAYRPHLRLAVDETGACVFLGPEGCRLPREARPYYCRLYPAWVVGGRVTLFTPEHCEVVARGRNVPGLLRELGTTAAEIRLLYGRLRLAWGLDPDEGTPPAQRAATNGRS